VNLLDKAEKIPFVDIPYDLGILRTNDAYAPFEVSACKILSPYSDLQTVQCPTPDIKCTV
jgi:hypothetical protein